MVNLVKRENRDASRGANPAYLDPFRMMDALLRWDPLRSDRGGFESNQHRPAGRGFTENDDG